VDLCLVLNNAESALGSQSLSLEMLDGKKYSEDVDSLINSVFVWNYLILLYLLLGVCLVLILIVSSIIAQQILKRHFENSRAESVSSLNTFSQVPNRVSVIPLDRIFQTNSTMAFQNSFQEHTSREEFSVSQSNLGASESVIEIQPSASNLTSNGIQSNRATSLVYPLQYIFSLGKRGFWRLIVRGNSTPVSSTIQ
jgi:hypothetical protein